MLLYPFLSPLAMVPLSLPPCPMELLPLGLPTNLGVSERLSRPGACPPAKCFLALLRHSHSTSCSRSSYEPICKREKLRCRKDTGPNRVAQLARGTNGQDKENSH